MYQEKLDHSGEPGEGHGLLLTVTTKFDRVGSVIPGLSSGAGG